MVVILILWGFLFIGIFFLVVFSYFYFNIVRIDDEYLVVFIFDLKFLFSIIVEV